MERSSELLFCIDESTWVLGDHIAFKTTQKSDHVNKKNIEAISIVDEINNRDHTYLRLQGRKIIVDSRRFNGTRDEWHLAEQFKKKLEEKGSKLRADYFKFVFKGFNSPTYESLKAAIKKASKMDSSEAIDPSTIKQRPRKGEKSEKAFCSWMEKFLNVGDGHLQLLFEEKDTAKKFVVNDFVVKCQHVGFNTKWAPTDVFLTCANGKEVNFSLKNLDAEEWNAQKCFLMTYSEVREFVSEAFACKNGIVCIESERKCESDDLKPWNCQFAEGVTGIAKKLPEHLVEEFIFGIGRTKSAAVLVETFDEKNPPEFNISCTEDKISASVKVSKIFTDIKEIIGTDYEPYMLIRTNSQDNIATFTDRYYGLHLAIVLRSRVYKKGTDEVNGQILYLD